MDEYEHYQRKSDRQETRVYENKKKKKTSENEQMLCARDDLPSVFYLKW